MLRLLIIVLLATLLLAGCGANPSDRFVGEWIGRPEGQQDPNSPVTAQVDLTLNRDGTAKMAGQEGKWRVASSTGASANLEVDMPNPATKTTVTFKLSVTWINDYHFRSGQPDGEILLFERKKS